MAARSFRALMVQGTGSDVGKSLLVAGLARAYVRRGLKVAPFKPQNMSNNAAVTADGGEIGRAQALQARAAGVAASIHMNPVLLKPTTDVGAQVVVQGRVLTNATARDYRDLKPQLMAHVLDSFARVGAGRDLVLVEGAGSAAEVNLRAGDIANYGFAEAAGVPVVLAGDIDRGGVIAALVGTHVLLSEAERGLTAGYLINKFRGDAGLFADGLTVIGAHTGLRCFGVVPYFPAARLLPKEDGQSLDGAAHETRGGGAIKIVVPRLPRLSNFDDLDPLAQEADVAVRFVEAGEVWPRDADAVVLPGSKATLADLAFLKDQGWDAAIRDFANGGGMVVGLCGGYQMLGTRIDDPNGVEGPPSGAEGLGLLAVETVLSDEKTLEHVSARDVPNGCAVAGYEMHMGLSEGPDRKRPWMMLSDGRAEGARSAGGRIMGTYLHGLFAADGFRHAFLSGLRVGRSAGGAYEARIDAVLDDLAAHLEAHLDMDALLAAAL